MSERTTLAPVDEAQFQAWVQANATAPGVRNHEHAAYDMRGFFADKAALAQWKPGDHFPDTYKQHGHESFSQESQYSTGPSDGGMWLNGKDANGNDVLLAQPPMAVSHAQDPATLLKQKLMAALKGSR